MKLKNHHIISALLVCCMLLGLLPAMGTTAQAASVTTVPSGYKGIYTANDLDSIRNDLSGNYILMNDIYLSSWGNWTPIGTGWSGVGFTGTFDGNSYAIKNMVIDDSSVIKDYNGGYQYAGLFATLKGATVKNIRYISGSISCANSPCLEAGAVAGCSYGSTISRCASYVNISYKYGEPDGNAVLSTSGMAFNCGGIVGLVMDSGDYGATTISECSNHALISGVSKGAPIKVGGITGENFVGEITIENCYNAGGLSARTGNVEADVGGILGYGWNVDISNCYNIGFFACEVADWKFDRQYVGGIAGNLINTKDNVVSRCYYLSDAPAAVGSVRVRNAEGYENKINLSAKAANSSALQKQSTYSGFDFSKIWKMGSGSNTYPVLRWCTESTATSTSTTTNGKTGCAEHKYKSASGNICTVCGYEYEPQLFEFNRIRYAVKDNVPIRDNYYSNNSKIVNRLSKGDSVKVTHWLKNALGNNWYITEDGYYIYVENLSRTSPYAHTLTFDANGGTGAPEAVTTAGYKYGISSTNVPTRSGYSFQGWSTNKNATTVEYKAGQAIRMDKDITLYAVWAKNISSLSSLSPEIVKALNCTTGIAQQSDKCTKCATATLLKRRQVATGKAGTFTLDDIELGAGYSNINPGSNVYESNGNTYTCTAVQPNRITGDPMKYIIDLLDEHPEGIVIYCNYYNLYGKRDSLHAIVLSDYEKNSNDSYTIYAYDPSNGTSRIKLEETSLYKGCNSTEHSKYMKKTSYASYENVFANFVSGSCGCIWYVKTES